MEKARFKWVLRERNRKIAAKTEVLLSSRHVECGVFTAVSKSIVQHR